MKTVREWYPCTVKMLQHNMWRGLQRSENLNVEGLYNFVAVLYRCILMFFLPLTFNDDNSPGEADQTDQHPGKQVWWSVKHRYLVMTRWHWYCHKGTEDGLACCQSTINANMPTPGCWNRGHQDALTMMNINGPTNLSIWEVADVQRWLLKCLQTGVKRPLV